ncbi:hypothetical protein PR202_ga11729 [Eleusine coracana subsp. coracana]|uniref:FAD/NAD(P)-binding domain-containing protein n=1 Tax=Eleusine coracana subsp. coracana TaxID=191504 RepID=A0AAV5C9P1_ELECO|nr:hypothetical protein PR202_ga11729 [Eleusine coracana subsp. coracana]
MPPWPSLPPAFAATRLATPSAFFRRNRRCSSSSNSAASSGHIHDRQQEDGEEEEKEQSLVVVGGGAAGVYASIWAKSLAPRLNVVVIEKGRFLSKVKYFASTQQLPIVCVVFLGGRKIDAPRVTSRLQVKISGGGRCNVTNGHHIEPMALARNYPRGNKELRGSFFSAHGPQDTMRWFTDHGVELKAGKSVSNVSINEHGKFLLKVEKRTADLVDYINANYVLVATGHISNSQSKTEARWRSENCSRFDSGKLMVDFIPDIDMDDVKSILFQHKDQHAISLGTMESKKQPNIFFAGEILNVDGVTGGFNFQDIQYGQDQGATFAYEL